MMRNPRGLFQHSQPFLQATKAVAEAFLGGCIPVFVGPPWHSMPFAEVVPYKDTALFLKLQNTSAFLDKVRPQGSSLLQRGYTSLQLSC